MGSKYERDIYNLLTFSKIKSTKENLKGFKGNQHTAPLQNSVKEQKINWYTAHRVLRDLKEAGDVECYKSKWG